MKETAGLNTVSFSVINMVSKKMTRIAMLLPLEANMPYVNTKDPIVAINVDLMMVCFSS